jgi:RimJ/RimL family protein N-acetyltransferase
MVLGYEVEEDMSFYFKRLKNGPEILNDFYIRTIDDPEYDLFSLSSWHGSTSRKMDGWGDDAFFIMKNDIIAGFILWDISREDDKISNVVTALEKRFLNSGLGPLALLSWMDYIFTRRNFRKVEFNVALENKRARRVYMQCPGVVSTGIQRQSRKTATGEYVDMELFEVMRKDYMKAPKPKLKLLELKQEASMESKI